MYVFDKINESWILTFKYNILILKCHDIKIQYCHLQKIDQIKWAYWWTNTASTQSDNIYNIAIFSSKYWIFAY